VGKLKNCLRFKWLSPRRTVGVFHRRDKRNGRINLKIVIGKTDSQSLGPRGLVGWLFGEVGVVLGA